MSIPLEALFWCCQQQDNGLIGNVNPFYRDHLSSLENSFEMACIDMIWVKCYDLFHPAPEGRHLMESYATMWVF